MLTSIEDRAFAECINLKSIEIPDNVTEIGKESFYGCKQLEIKLPKNLKKIGKNAFEGVQPTQIKVPRDLDLNTVEGWNHSWDENVVRI